MEKMKPCQHLVANTFKYICPEFILCHTCKKNKINIIFYPCGHAVIYNILLLYLDIMLIMFLKI